MQGKNFHIALQLYTTKLLLLNGISFEIDYAYTNNYEPS